MHAGKTQKTGRNKQRERGWRADYPWVHLRCASWSFCWPGLEILIRGVTAHWRWQPHTSPRNKQRGKHPGSREAVKHHPGTYKASHKHASHSYFTCLLDAASRHIQDIQVSTRRSLNYISIIVPAAGYWAIWCLKTQNVNTPPPVRELPAKPEESK